MNKIPVSRNDPKTDYIQSKERKAQKDVLQDIQKIDATITAADFKNMLELHRYLDGKYQACISDWGKGMYGYNPEYGFNLEFVDQSSIEDNLKLMKPKLEAFSKGWNSKTTTTHGAQRQEVSVVLNNTNTVQMSITFDDARNQVEEMSALNKEQTDEIIHRIDELEAVLAEKDTRKGKWEKIKPIVTWAIEKGVDVAIIILKLIAQSQLG